METIPADQRTDYLLSGALLDPSFGITPLFTQEEAKTTPSLEI